MPPVIAPDAVPVVIAAGRPGRRSPCGIRLALVSFALALAGCAHRVAADDRGSTATPGANQAARALDERVSDLEARLDRAEYALVAVNRRALDAQRRAGCALARDTCAAVLPASRLPQSSIAPQAFNPQSESQSITASVGRLLAAAHRPSPAQSP